MRQVISSKVVDMFVICASLADARIILTSWYTVVSSLQALRVEIDRLSVDGRHNCPVKPWDL